MDIRTKTTLIKEPDSPNKTRVFGLSHIITKSKNYICKVGRSVAASETYSCVPTVTMFCLSKKLYLVGYCLSDNQKIFVRWSPSSVVTNLGNMLMIQM